jgi:hypothetical protein
VQLDEEEGRHGGRRAADPEAKPAPRQLRFHAPEGTSGLPATELALSWSECQSPPVTMLRSG